MYDISPKIINNILVSLEKWNNSLNDIESIGDDIIIFFKGVYYFCVDGLKGGFINIFLYTKETELHNSKERRL
jgi:hypothetical protein